MTTIFIALIAALGTPMVALLIYFFNRRSTLRNLDTATDATMLASAGEVVKILQSQNVLQESQIQVLNERLLNAEATRVADQADFIERIRLAQEESRRTNTIIAKLQNDLDVTQRQVGLLRDQFPRG